MSGDILPPKIDDEEREVTLEEFNGNQAAIQKISYLDLVYGALFKPKELFLSMTDNRLPVFKCFVIFSGVTMLNAVTQNLLTPHNFAGMGMFDEVAAEAVPFLSVIGATFAFIIWLGYAGILNLVAELFEGRGSAIKMLCLLALADLPRLIIIPFEVMGSMIKVTSISTLLPVLGAVVYLGWWLYILLIGIKVFNGFGTGKAMVVLAIPLFIAFASLTIVTLAGVGVLVPLLNILSSGG